MDNVKENRHLYIGGSDIPTIMSINSFKSRYDLLLEKAKIKEDDFKGNDYTEYGNILEHKIRDYVNKLYSYNFEPNSTIIEEDVLGIRYNSDGCCDTHILEIKTTSNIKSSVHEYKTYLVQLLLGMVVNKKEKGILAIYDRPLDFRVNTEFDYKRLTTYEIDIDDYDILVKEIQYAITRFKLDFQELKETYDLTGIILNEWELDPTTNELQVQVNKVALFEKELEKADRIKKELEKVKQNIKKHMIDNAIKSIDLPNTKITISSDSVRRSIDSNKLKEEMPEVYEKYQKETLVQGSLRITFKKENKENE